jgi:diaminohydroxyphosphoribosylaminopyrimidine deaminase/5-amino-6-(5-phosphoribosylamino)uracil reductase
MADPFPQVAGRGAELLRAAGVTVEVGVGEAEARRLNAPYLKLQATGRPWVIAKWAMTLDGKIATATGHSQWISGEESRRRVHELRGRVDAVIVGGGTVRTDDPLLTARPPGPRTAARVVVSASADLPADCKLLQTVAQAPVMVMTAEPNVGKLAHWRERGCEVIGLPDLAGRANVAALLDELGRRRMTNVLVEGGSGLLGSFLDARAIDEVWAFVTPVLVGGRTALTPGGGDGAATIPEGLRLVECESVSSGEDWLIRGRLTDRNRTHS